MPRVISLITLVAALTTVAASAKAEAPRPTGLIVPAPPAGPTPVWARLADLLSDSLRASGQWDPTILNADSPLVRAAGVEWPDAKAAPWSAQADRLGPLARELRLSAVLVISYLTGAETVMEVLWGEADSPEVKGFILKASGNGEGAAQSLVRQLVARLGEGYAAAPVVTETITPPTSNGGETSAVSESTTAVQPEAETKAEVTAPATDEIREAATGQPATGAAEVSPPTATVPPGRSEAATSTESPVTTPSPDPAAAVVPAEPVVATPPVGEVTEPPAAEVTPGSAATSETAEATTVAAAEADDQTTVREPSVYLVSAEKYLREGEYQRALDWGDQALEAGDDKATVYYLFARTEAARQNRQAQRRWLERTLEADPGHAAARLQLAEVLREGGLWHKAIEEYQLVIEQAPESLHAYLGLSAIYAQHAQPRRAAELLAEALAHHPHEVNLYLRMGDLHAQRGAPAEAEAAYSQAARHTQGADRAQALDRLGDLYMEAGRQHEAFICFAEASKLRPMTDFSVAEKRYQQVMQAADQALLQTVQHSERSLQSYLGGGNITRGEAYEAFVEASQQVQVTRELAEVMVAPESRRLEHARRKLAYTLTSEMVTLGLLYLDTNQGDTLTEYQLRLSETHRSFAELTQTTP
jgi:tetratricopeptide (TPR) repeat protein